MTPLVVASYNIHRGVGLDRRLDLDRVAEVIREISPDIIGLQEVVRRPGGPPVAAWVPGAKLTDTGRTGGPLRRAA